MQNPRNKSFFRFAIADFLGNIAGGRGGLYKVPPHPLDIQLVEKFVIGFYIEKRTGQSQYFYTVHAHDSNSLGHLGYVAGTAILHGINHFKDAGSQRGILADDLGYFRSAGIGVVDNLKNRSESLRQRSNFTYS